MNNFIEDQNWRYATKKFDTTKKISSTDIEILKKAIQLSSSSFGLQPYKVFIIENKEIRKQLLPVSWGQSQVVDASHLFVFANYTNVQKEHITTYITNVATTRSLNSADLQGYLDFMISKIVPLPKEQKEIWTAKQAYLALGNLLNCAANLKIDATPMEGFDADAYNNILGLHDQNLAATLVVALGYRHEEDQTQHLKKVRKPISELFQTI